VHLGDRRLAAHIGAGRQFDLDVERAARAERAEAAPRAVGADLEAAVGELGADPLRRLDVVRVGRVARRDRDDGVGALARPQPDVGDDEVERDGDRFWSGESGHGKALPCQEWWMEKRELADPAGQALAPA
jgi:hypothetical protein